jgi:hypothetical protein
MIDGRQLLAGLQPLRKRIEDDLRERSEQVPELGQRLRAEWQAARERERTAQTYEAWRDDTLAQAAVMWLLASVFVRFLEDNALVDSPRLAGPGPRLQLARDQRTLYFQAHPHDSDRDYARPCSTESSASSPRSSTSWTICCSRAISSTPVGISTRPRWRRSSSMRRAWRVAPWC